MNDHELTPAGVIALGILRNRSDGTPPEFGEEGEANLLMKPVHPLLNALYLCAIRQKMEETQPPPFERSVSISMADLVHYGGYNYATFVPDCRELSESWGVVTTYKVSGRTRIDGSEWEEQRDYRIYLCGIEFRVRADMTVTQDPEPKLYGSGWGKRRKSALLNADDRCMLCNSSEDLHVHHRTYARQGKEHPDDLVALCLACHQLFHGRRELSERQTPVEKRQIPTQYTEDTEFQTCVIQTLGRGDSGPMLVEDLLAEVLLSFPRYSQELAFDIFAYMKKRGFIDGYDHKGEVGYIGNIEDYSRTNANLILGQMTDWKAKTAKEINGPLHLPMPHFMGCMEWLIANNKAYSLTDQDPVLYLERIEPDDTEA